jgi:glyoxylase-like metal-dependent hydrolase (beta-lactamase superfamily II)
MESPGRSQREASTVHRIEIGVDWPPGNVVVTLIDGPEPILVDAGMVGEQARDELEAGLANAGVSLAEIEHLVVTHPHVDHLGQAPALREEADPTIYAPAGVRQRLDRDRTGLEETVRHNGTAAGLHGDVLDMAIEKSTESLERNRSLLPSDAVDHWIEHDQLFTVGGLELLAIHTPGHQADHCCYYGTLSGEEVLFSGDLLLEPFRSVVIHTGLDDGVEDGVHAFYTALDRLDGLAVDRVFTGHGPAHQQFEGTIERSRNSLDRMLDHTHGLIEDGCETALDIAAERSGNREIQYVLCEVVGALAYLEDEDRIERSTEAGINQYRVTGE